MGQADFRPTGNITTTLFSLASVPARIKAQAVNLHLCLDI